MEEKYLGYVKYDGPLVNQDAKYSAQNMPRRMGLDMWSRFDSISFVCSVPTNCNPEDKENLAPFSFVYLKSYLEKGLSYADIMGGAE